MFLSDVWASVPGIGAALETYEAAFQWGQKGLGVITGGYISQNTIDSGNTPTWEIRPGLLLGQQLSTGQWINYAPTNTDGSEVAAGVLLTGLRMQDLQGNPVPRFYGILVGGPVQAAKLLGLDLMARQQMDKFQFDDLYYLGGSHWFPWRRFQSKTANYSCTIPGDNYCQFDNAGAAGAVTITLPPIGPGLMIGIRALAAQTLAVTSNEGGNIVALNNAAASTLTFSTGSQIIGGGLRLFTNPAGTLWEAENASAGSNTITVS